MVLNLDLLKRNKTPSIFFLFQVTDMQVKNMWGVFFFFFFAKPAEIPLKS